MLANSITIGDAHPENVSSAELDTDIATDNADLTEVATQERSAQESVILSEDIARTWLSWQAPMVAGTLNAVIYRTDGSTGIGAPLTSWPNEVDAEFEAELLKFSELALSENRGVEKARWKYISDNKRVCDLIASPLRVNDQPVAVVAFMITTRSEVQRNAVLQLLQWGGMWIETLVRQQAAAEQGIGLLALELTSDLFAHRESQAALMGVVNRLADHFDCERVSIGLRDGLSVRVAALSHLATFDGRSQLIRELEAAMEESMDQACPIVCPPPVADGSGITRAHTFLLKRYQNTSVCTFPVSGEHEIIGAITLERRTDKSFDELTLRSIEIMMRMIGPVLELKKRRERPLVKQGLEFASSLMARIFGSSGLRYKIIAMVLVAFIGVISVINVNYRVTTPASIEGAVRQVLVAPASGYIKQADVSAGDQVTRGQVVAKLDDSNLRLELKKWQGEKNQFEKEYQDALARHDRAKMSVLRARIDQVSAEAQRVMQTIVRTEIRAPFDGTVISGDLSRSLGAPVEIGETLFEITPLDGYRVVLEVDDRDVADLDAGHSGQLILAALPGATLNIIVDKLVPVAVTRDGRNYFRVEAILNKTDTLLRPGMRGIAKVDIGPRQLLWIWTHTVVDQLRIWFWSWGF